MLNYEYKSFENKPWIIYNNKIINKYNNKKLLKLLEASVFIFTSWMLYIQLVKIFYFNYLISSHFNFTLLEHSTQFQTRFKIRIYIHTIHKLKQNTIFKFRTSEMSNSSLQPDSLVLPNEDVSIILSPF